MLSKLLGISFGLGVLALVVARRTHAPLRRAVLRGPADLHDAWTLMMKNKADKFAKALKKSD